MKYKPGDRVRVFGSFAPKEGGGVRWLDGDKGTVKEVSCYGSLTIKLDVPFAEPYLKEPGVVDEVHPKQVRRLRPAKPRRRLWVPNPNCVFWKSRPGAPALKFKNAKELYSYLLVDPEDPEAFTEFVEVRRKK